jgi:hypothetical protein
VAKTKGGYEEGRRQRMNGVGAGCVEMRQDSCFFFLRQVLGPRSSVLSAQSSERGISADSEKLKLNDRFSGGVAARNCPGLINAIEIP